MPKERPLWRGPAFRLCLLSAALFLCLQLGMRRSWCPEEKPRVPAAGRSLPPAQGTEQHQQHQAGRRRVTYVRSGRRGSESPGGCCPLQPPGIRRRKTVRWHIELQPWASPTPSLNYEALRFLKYISTSQISCEHMNLSSLRGYSETTKKPWSICLDERFSLIHRIRSKQCRLYSLGLGNDDNQFETSMANSGCEVHRFDPSIKSAHIHEGQHLWYHRLSIDWRDPNPAIAAHKLHSNTKKLGTILNEFGHQKIDVLKADVESAEWKILENLILEDVVEQIGQLVVEVHVHWPGFELPHPPEGPCDTPTGSQQAARDGNKRTGALPSSQSERKRTPQRALLSAASAKESETHSSNSYCQEQHRKVPSTNPGGEGAQGPNHSKSSGVCWQAYVLGLTLHQHAQQYACTGGHCRRVACPLPQTV